MTAVGAGAALGLSILEGRAFSVESDVSEAELRRAVQEGGPMADDVARELGRRL